MNEHGTSTYLPLSVIHSASLDLWIFITRELWSCGSLEVWSSAKSVVTELRKWEYGTILQSNAVTA